MSRLSRRSAIGLLTGAPLALGARRPAQAQAQRPKVVATFSILGDIVANIGGDRIELTTLVGPGGDAHTYEPSPSDLATLSEAALVVEIGAGFEGWLDDIYSSSGSQATRLVLTDSIPLLAIGEHTHDHEDEHDAEHADDEHEDDHDHEDGDPHIWHDVKNAALMTALIRNALMFADTVNADAYGASSESYLATLNELEAFAQAEAAKLPPDRRKIVTSHDSLGYLAAAYGFEIVGTALGSLSTEAADPSAGEIADLVEEIRAAGVPAIFTEGEESTDLMQGLADEAGVTLAPPLYTDALSESDGPAPSYVELVRYNMTTIVTALGGPAA